MICHATAYILQPLHTRQVCIRDKFASPLRTTRSKKNFRVFARVPNYYYLLLAIHFLLT